MAQFQNMIITRAGLDMIAQSQAGGTLIFTKGKLGDGQIGDQSIPDLTDLINAKMSVELSSVTAKTEGHVEVRFIVDNTDLNVGFFVREVGIFAKVNEEGVEKLYGYANAGNYANYLADKTVPIDSIITKIDLVVGNASNVTFTTDKSIVYVTLKDMEDALAAHDDNVDAHEDAFAAHNADNGAHNDMVIGATTAAAGKRGMVPAPTKGQQDMPLVGGGSFKVLPVAGGGTGGNTAEAARSNLGISSKIGINPVGTIIAYAASGAIPEGYLPCNGAAVSRSTYANLFGVIGTLYGEGDGSTTFNLPDLTDRFLEGSSTAGNEVQSGLPNIGGVLNSASYNYLWRDIGSGALYAEGSTTQCSFAREPTDSEKRYANIRLDASRSSSVYGKSNTVQPASVTMLFLVKY